MAQNDAIHARHSVKEIRRASTDQRVADLAPVIAELRASGVTSLGIAKALNQRGIPNVAGSGRWYHPQVVRLLARLEGVNGDGGADTRPPSSTILIAHSPPNPGSRSTRSSPLRQVQTIRWSRHSARQKTFSLTRPPDARPHRGSISSLWSTSRGRSSEKIRPPSSSCGR
jgi:hypothetical protein